MGCRDNTAAAIDRGVKVKETEIIKLLYRWGKA